MASRLRRRCLFAFVAALMPGLAAASLPANAETAAFAGTWMHVGDPYGVVIAHLEVLTIAPSGAVTAELIANLDYLSGCVTPEGRSQPHCAPRRVTERGTLLVEPVSRTLRIGDVQDVELAFGNEAFQMGWQVIRAAGDEPWRYRLEGDRLEITRQARIEDYDFELVKVYRRVAEAEPDDIFAMLRMMGASLVQAGCAIDAIHSDESLKAAFRALVARIAALAGLVREAGLEQHDMAMSADRIPGADPADVAAYRALRAWWDDNDEAGHLLFPDATRVRPEIVGCIESLP